MAKKVELYGVIGSEWWGKTAAQLVAELRAIAMADDDDNDVELHINSGGGYVDDAVAMYSRLREHAKANDAEIHVIIDGLAASAATLVAMAGDVVSMPDTAAFMIHQPWSFAAGSSPKLRKSADVLDLYEDRMVAAYLRKASELDEAELRSLLAEETWMSAEDAKSYGFIDEIIEDEGEEAEALALVAVSEYLQRAANHEKLVAYAAVPQKFQASRAPAPMTAAPPMAAARSTRGEEEMPEETQPTDAQAAAPTAPKPPSAEEILAAERSRVKAIRELCEAHDVPDICAELESNGSTIEVARERVLNALVATRPQQNPVVAGGEDSREKRIKGVEKALMIRAGLMPAEEARAEYGQNPYMGRSLLRIAEDFLDPRASHGTPYDIASQVLDAGRHLPSGRVQAATLSTPVRNVLATHTTGDFSNILANVAYKSMLKGWDSAPGTWRPWCNIGTLQDFKQANRTGLNDLPELSRLPEGATYQGSQLDDRNRTIQLVTYGNFLTITRQALVNDDMGAFTRIPQKFGAAAARTVNGVVYSTFLDSGDGPTIEGAALFSSTHTTTANVSAALDAAAIAKLTEQMRLQKAPALPNGDTHDQTLNITPSVLLVPAAFEHDARIQTQSAWLPEGSNGATVTNVNPSLQVVVEGRLDDDSSSQFYMVADPNQYDTLEVAFLNGMQQPFLERMPMSNVDGQQFKVRIDVGASVLDFRGFQRGT